MGAMLTLLGASAAAGPAPDPADPFAPWTPAELYELSRSGDGSAEVVEEGLAQLARAEGAYDVALAEGLAALCVGDRLVALGFSKIVDYGREVLDLAPRTTQALVELGRGLRTRPFLRAALHAGRVRLRAAETILPVAVGDAEERWVARARRETVRALEAAVRRERAGAPEEEWIGFGARLTADERARVDRALELAGSAGAGPSRAERLEAIAQEYLSEHPLEAAGADAEPPRPMGRAFRPVPCPEVLEARLEEETDRWSHLGEVADHLPPLVSFDDLATEADIHARLCAIGAERRVWDRAFGHCALLVKRSRIWQLAGFSRFAHYCRERLGLSPRMVEQRAALEERLWQTPALREARDAGVSYERLRLLARCRGDLELREWVPKAPALTVVELRAALAAHHDAQMRARRIFRARIPARVASDLQAAIRTVQKVEGALLPVGSCLGRMAEVFTAVWKPYERKPRTASQKVRARDLGRCQVPGCSRCATHAHHVIPRSRGGTDDPWNLVALCAFHHLRGVHGGYLRVRGRAPDALVWEIGPRHAPVDLRALCLAGLAPFAPAGLEAA